MEKELREEQAEWVKRCQEGNPTFQKKFYERFAPVLFGICLRYSSQKEDAQDLLHDGFIHAFEHLHLFRNEGSLEGWLKRMFVNLALERIRKQAIRFKESDLDSAFELADPLTTDAGLNQQDILKGIQQLPPACRTVFNLFIIEGFSHQEIGQMLDISENTSKAHVFRARNLLQDYLKKIQHGATKAR